MVFLLMCFVIDVAAAGVVVVDVVVLVVVDVGMAVLVSLSSSGRCCRGRGGEGCPMLPPMPDAVANLM